MTFSQLYSCGSRNHDALQVKHFCSEEHKQCFNTEMTMTSETCQMMTEIK